MAAIDNITTSFFNAVKSVYHERNIRFHDPKFEGFLISETAQSCILKSINFGKATQHYGFDAEKRTLLFRGLPVYPNHNLKDYEILILLKP